VPWGPGLLPRLRDMTASFPFAGSTSNKAEHVSQRETQRHTEDTDTAGHTHCHRQGPAEGDSHKHKHRQPSPLLLIRWLVPQASTLAGPPKYQHRPSACPDLRPTYFPAGPA